MTTITFTGDPRCPGTDPKEINMFGIVFPLGKPVEVEDDKIAARLWQHSHFTGSGEAQIEASDEPAKADRMAAARAARAAKKAAEKASAEKVDA